MERRREQFRGCLLGGAVGDALGWPVEFMKYRDIVRKFGARGITDLIPGDSGKAEITDDTQMTLFTAEGLLRANIRGYYKGICHAPSFVYQAYLRWLHTQGYAIDPELSWIYNGWLLTVKGLYAKRAPGNSCLSALLSGKTGTIDQPINNSKGCGGVMRVAPVGLVYSKDAAFQIACECAALTHGHPSGYLPAGFLAYVIAALVEGFTLERAVRGGFGTLQTYRGHEECSGILRKAWDLAGSDTAPETAQTILGAGWVGEEALAVAIYCALKYAGDFRRALCVAVNHDGDSDSTGAITGNILGACLGAGSIPAQWAAKVELAEVVEQMAEDLLTGFAETDDWHARYSGG